jgi:hypothetical protein
MDLPAFQYADLGFSLQMRPEQLQAFDKFIFSRADVLWVCSGSIAGLICDRYGIDQRKSMVVLNGLEKPEALRAEAGEIIRSVLI